MTSALARHLHDHTRNRPDAPALIHVEPDGSQRALSWAQLDRAAAALARRLREQTPDDASVMIALCNRAAFHIGFLATLLADRRAFPFNPESTPAEFAAAIDSAGVATIIGEPGMVTDPAFDAVPVIDRRTLTDHDAEIDPVATLAQHRGTGAMRMVSCATRGQPKIVERSTASLDAVATHCAAAVGLTPDDRVLLPVLLHHSFGLEHGLLGPLVAGAAVEVHAMFDVTRLLDRLADPAVTVFPAVPFVFEAIAQAGGGRLLGTTGLHVRRAYSAGGVLPDAVIDACQQRLGLTIGQVYGSTEVGSVTFSDPDDPHFDPGSAGRALPGASIRVVKSIEPTLGRDLPAGRPGHVVVRSDGMFRGYIDSDDARIVDGYFITGDLGTLDEHGQLRITGRTKVLIDVDGRKVNPLEVEAVIEQHPAVSGAVVVPLPVTRTANRLRAVVVPEPGEAPTDAELRLFTRQRLSAHKVPRVFEFRHELPRDAGGELAREAV